MNNVKKTSTGVTPAHLILSHSIILSVVVLIQVTYAFQIEWMNGFHVNIHYLSSLKILNIRVISTKSSRLTPVSLITLSIHMCCIDLHWDVVISYFPSIKDHIKLEVEGSLSTYQVRLMLTICDPFSSIIIKLTLSKSLSRMSRNL